MEASTMTEQDKLLLTLTLDQMTFLAELLKAEYARLIKGDPDASKEAHRARMARIEMYNTVSDLMTKAFNEAGDAEHRNMLKNFQTDTDQTTGSLPPMPPRR
jgi:hypothetical protein